MKIRLTLDWLYHYQRLPDCVVVVYVRLPCGLSKPNYIFKQINVLPFVDKNDVVKGFICRNNIIIVNICRNNNKLSSMSAGTTTWLSLVVDTVSSTSGSLITDADFVLIYLWSLLIRIIELTALIHSNHWTRIFKLIIIIELTALIHSGFCLFTSAVHKKYFQFMDC